ncbi:DNA damage-regulated autophagy modulator protein 1-like [Stegodyphus dumicola]|uniref:DNA damage-regulated autophagy modulator protein 1-like n=1 Tax=Stegodyphus dumicola TaxID=202533 RepID=UPI0015B0AEA7|nr:DNA damage-regulated autophagy modulator protein 1-like [Stegodyphus dumicola]XP_035222754.1 DNA damage-regulated autophagy modulator protein 1-like [Stegodyphus dumicola]
MPTGGMVGLVMERVKFLPLLTSSCMLLAVSLPYLVAVTLEKVHMFLPYISHAAAFPPESAFLSIFMAIGTFFGIPTFFLRFVAVDQKRNRLEPRKIRILNIIALGVGCLAAIAMLLSSHYPVGYVTHERYDWMKSVVIPHFSCTALLITLYTVYVLIQAYLTYVQRKKSTKNVFVHATLAMCVVITNWTSCLPFYAAMREMAPRIVDAETGEITLESKEYSFYYIISSLSEWAFTFFSILFIATFYRDFKHMKLKVEINRKRITSINLDSVATHSTANGHEEITKM